MPERLSYKAAPGYTHTMTMRATPVREAALIQIDLRAELARVHLESHAWAVRCCGGDANDAGDVLHRAYMKVLEGKARYEGRSAFKTWFFGVVRCTAHEHRRQGWLQLARLERWWREREPNERSTVEDERVMRLRSVLTRLSKRQQEVLHLVFYQNLTIHEAAEVLALPIGTARTHYERGKARLRELLANAESR
jgi:RNA polymerase sigma-70 factor (ECF subfamily)